MDHKNVDEYEQILAGYGFNPDGSWKVNPVKGYCEPYKKKEPPRAEE